MTDEPEESIPMKKARVEEQPSTSRADLDFTSDEVIDQQLGSESHQELNVNNEELEQLRHFQVLDEVDNENDSEDNADSDTSGEDVPDEEIEKMLEADLPEEMNTSDKPRQKLYHVYEKMIMEEKGTSHLEVLPQDWIKIRHNSGIPIYLHRTGRVCTLSRPYFLGNGSTKKHDIPLSAIPCLNYRKALEEEIKQKKVQETIENAMKSGKVFKVDKPTVLTDEFLNNILQNGEIGNGIDGNDVNMDVNDVHTDENDVNMDVNDVNMDRNDLDSDIQLNNGNDVSEISKNDNKLHNNSESDQQNKTMNDDLNENEMTKCPFGGMTEDGKSGVDNEVRNTDAEESWNRPVLLPDGKILAPTKIESVHESWKKQHLSHDEVFQYCQKLFKFIKIHSKSFKFWSKRRKYSKAKKKLQRPVPPEGSKLITITQPAAGDNKRPVQKEWIMNTQGKSIICIFHDYVMLALNKQPVYTFQQLENAATPYQATVTIGDMQYGVGFGSSKRQAKSEAAKASMKILLPDMKDSNEQADKDFAVFDFVSIEDPRITDFCNSMMEPSPHAILKTCLLRNFGADRQIQYETKFLHRQRIQYIMRVGKHTASVICKNKKIGKQRASQAILQALHPHIKSWGSLLRLYGSRSVKSCKEKKTEEQQITLLQDKATVNQPNYAILEKLRSEMRRLKERDEAVAPIGTMVLDIPLISSSDLNNVEL